MTPKDSALSTNQVLNRLGYSRQQYHKAQFPESLTSLSNHQDDRRLKRVANSDHKG